MKIRLLVLLIIVICAGSVTAQENPQATFTPDTFSVKLCGDNCHTQRIKITLPPLPTPPMAGVDLVLLLDVTGSMESVLHTAQNSAEQVVTDLRDLNPDLRFALAIYADYPMYDGSAGDEPFRLVAPFTTDLPTFRDQINQATLQDGGDFAESGWRALSELTELDWRPDAAHVIIVFTDATAHDPDPGRDEQMGTDDDLASNEVTRILKNKEIIVFGVDASGSSDSREFLNPLASATGGSYETLRSADEIPQTIISLVGQVIHEQEINLTPLLDAQLVDTSGWAQFDPTSFEYPREGGEVEVEITICPYYVPQAVLPDGIHDLSFKLVGGESEYGTLSATLDYARLCSDVYIKDNEADNGAGCTNDMNSRVPFWESPDIIVRRQPDEARVFEFPQVGQENYVYVRVRNRGSTPVQAARLAVYTSDNPFEVVFPANWREIGRASVDLPAYDPALPPDEDGVWVGPFTWTPSDPHVTLRALVIAEDDNQLLENDVACDNNIAQLNVIPMTLNIPSYGPDLLGGELAIHIEAPPSRSYETTDLTVPLDRFPEGKGFVSVQLDTNTFDAWDKGLSGGQIVGEGQIAADAGADALVIKDLSANDVKIDAQLVIASAETKSGELPISLEVEDRTWLGATIRYTVDASAVPGRRAPDTEPLPSQPIYKRITIIIPLALTALLLLGIIIIAISRRR